MTGPVGRLLGIARPELPRLALAVLAGIGAAGSSVGLMATAAWLISRAAQHPPVLYLMVAIVAVRFFGVARAVFRYAERLAAHDAALRVLTELRVRCFERLAASGAGRLRSGDLLARLSRDVDAVVDLLVRTVLPACVGLAVGTGAAVLIWSILPAAGVTLLAGLVLLAGPVPWLQARLGRAADRRIAPVRGDLSTRTVDLLAGLDELTVNGAASARTAQIRRIDAELARMEARTGSAGGLGNGLAALIAGAVVLMTLVTGVPAVQAGEVDPVLLAVLALTPIAVFEALSDLPAAIQQLGQVRAAAGRIIEVLDRPYAVPEPEHPEPLPTAPYTLRVEALTARWPGSERPALDRVDLELTPGKRIAVVGPSGAGKTSLAAVLLRLLDHESGRITLNGTDLRTLAGDDVRRVIGLCAADAHLFDTTLAANLTMARPGVTDAEMWHALEQAGLDGWVSSLPAGLQTRVGEHGERLSGGQRRRVALARALLADFPILILDEPTEHLDEDTAAAITTELLDATAGRTTILITHRPLPPGSVDQILTLGAGRVLQDTVLQDTVLQDTVLQDTAMAD
jgi:thiol reductant ABC exporter CydC subunit